MKTRITIAAAVAALSLSACANTSTTRLAQNMVRIDVSAAPACGRSGAVSVVSKTAAIETLRYGYDKYIIAGTGAENNVGVYGTSYNYNYATGGVYATPMIAGTHDANMTVVVFTYDDPAGAQALDARSALGADWQKIVAKGAPNTCG